SSDSKIFNIDSRKVLTLLRVLYSETENKTIPGKIDDYENEIFRVWSQEWPVLRRSFSFRNAGGEIDYVHSGIKFDVQILNSNIRTDIHESFNPDHIETFIIADIANLVPTTFRRFIWRYGADAIAGRKNFYDLVELFLLVNADNAVAKNDEFIISSVAKLFRTPNDCAFLKNDLLATGENRYSLINPVDPLVAISVFIKAPELAKSFSQELFVSSIQFLWAERRHEFLFLAIYSIDVNSPFTSIIVSEIKKIILPFEIYT
ncbi:hypothetical protein, partial [Leptospira sp. id769339]|uniref:hypothetical protein n=1 Tax=Leptospira sp. id769339 TaxID=2864221 RepID=UPI00214BC7E7